jgi:hypothetical protein
MADKVIATTRIDRLRPRADLEQWALTFCQTMAAGTLNECMPMSRYYRAPVFSLLFTGEPPRTGTSQVFARTGLDRYNSAAFATGILVPPGLPW